MEVAFVFGTLIVLDMNWALAIGCAKLPTLVFEGSKEPEMECIEICTSITRGGHCHLRISRETSGDVICSMLLLNRNMEDAELRC